MLLASWLSSCNSVATVSPATLAANAHMQKVEIATEHYSITSFQRMTFHANILRIYIEGDGRAWINSTTPSSDPTPKHAIGLQLATADPAPDIVYLARPCQYNLKQNPYCKVEDWTDKRYAEPMIQTMNQAIDQVMAQSHASKIELVGYSGGAAIAAIIASRRHDVLNLRTVAGNLDSEAVNQYHHVSAMPDSLNPMHIRLQLKNLPQSHFIGAQDKIIPSFVAHNFIANFSCAKIITIEHASHETGLVEAWPALLQQKLACQ